MMKTLITPEQTLALAFADAEYISPESISEADIVAATARYLQPIMGQPLIDALADGEHITLLEQYVAPALAFSVRLLVQPALCLRMGDGGLMAPRSDSGTAPNSSAVEALQRSVKKRARQLLLRLSAHLNANVESYPQYNPKLNTLNRCSIDGGIVQTF